MSAETPPHYRPAEPARVSRSSPSPKPQPDTDAARSIRPTSEVIGDQISEERIAEIRRRIAAGAYDSREVAGELARRMLESGDLDLD